MKGKGTRDIKQRFGIAVKRRRLELSISQEALADRAGLHRTYISEIELGRRNASVENIAKLARALDTTVSSLFRACEEP